MPALGPFIYENGVEPLTTIAQHSMLASYRENVAGGAAWVAANGGPQLTVGLAAMPSLHAGGAFLFLLFAWRSARVLLPIYLPLFAFIMLDAVANRWHYLIDLPVGILLAAACAWAAIRFNRSSRAAPLVQAGRPDFLSGLIGRLARRFA
jgi:membrane-associated phospholipid phosphatase